MIILIFNQTYACKSGNADDRHPPWTFVSKRPPKTCEEPQAQASSSSASASESADGVPLDVAHLEWSWSCSRIGSDLPPPPQRRYNSYIAIAGITIWCSRSRSGHTEFRRRELFGKAWRNFWQWEWEHRGVF